LAGIPVAVVTGEKSFMKEVDPATVSFLRDAEVAVDHLDLAEHGIHGNGHLPMCESNSDEVAALLLRWIEGALGRKLQTKDGLVYQKVSDLASAHAIKGFER
jgi:hypothetical protein